MSDGCYVGSRRRIPIEPNLMRMLCWKCTHWVTQLVRLTGGWGGVPTGKSILMSVVVRFRWRPVPKAALPLAIVLESSGITIKRS